MRSARIGIFVFCLFPVLAFAQKREYVELQRDVASLQDQIRSLERSNSESVGRITGMLQQTIESVNKLNTQVAVLDNTLRDRDKNISAPVATVGAKMDQMSGDFQAMKVSLDDLSSRLGKLQQNIIDLQNLQKVIQAPPAPPSSGPGGMAGAPPQGVTADSLYSNALRDKSTSPDMALQEFNDYLRYFGNTEMAPNAQYYVGEIYFNNKDYENALKAFDMVLEHYSENNKTLDAGYMKGRTLFQMGERTKAADEFRAVYNKAPKSELGAKAKAQLAAMGLSVNAPAAKRAAKKRR